MARSSSAHRSAPRGIPSSCRARGTAARGSGERSGARARGASADPQRRDRRTAGEACGDARSRSDRRRRAAEHRARPRPRRGPDGGVTLAATDVTGEVTDLVQRLIRNACVNDGTASMAVAVRRLLASGFRPKGTLIYSAVADEEALGTHGAQWLTENAWDDVRCDFLVTEFGGARFPLGSGAPKLPIMTAEKGSQWTRLRVRGTPGHGSMPYRSDNALVKAAEVISRIGRYRAPLRLHELWRRFVDGLDLPAAQRLALTTPATFDIALDRAPEGTAPMFYAATRTTFSPNMARAGVKLNVIPDSAESDIDIRTLAGDDGQKVRDMLREAIGDLWAEVEIVEEGANPASESPLRSPLWDTLTRVTRELVPGSETIPFLIVGATDARYFRRKGVTAYGYGLMSERISFKDFAKMFHGNDERIDQESLRLSTELFEQTARAFVG